MKKLFVIFLVVVAIFSLTCSKNTEQADQMDAKKILKATVSMVIGDVSVLRNNVAGKLKAKIGMQLYPEDVVVTGNGSKVNIVLEKTGVIRIVANSKVVLSSLLKKDNDATEQKISVKAGRIILGLKKLRKDSSFDVETPTAVAGVRGTSFMVSVEDNSDNAFPYFVEVKEKKDVITKVAVLAGAVEFSDKNSEKSVMVNSLKQAILSGADFDNVKVVDIKRLELEQLSEIKDFAEIKKLKMDQITEEIAEVEPEIQEMMKTELKTKSSIKKAKTADVSSKEKELDNSIQMKEKEIEKVKSKSKREGKYLEDQSAW